MSEPLSHVSGAPDGPELAELLTEFDATRTIDPVAMEKFRVRAKSDVERVLERLDRLRSIAGSRTYAYTYEQVVRIRDAIQNELDAVIAEFTGELDRLRRASEDPAPRKSFTL